MTSYVYNPSKKVTDILSKFLEFDPSELELGIWSGDLSLKHVNLRQDAINPLLNKGRKKKDPLKKDPLDLKLVSGSVGSMRIRIPWKRLVWGGGAVQLELSEVSIVLAFESREETEAKKKSIKKKKSKMKKEDNVTSNVTKAFRDSKQRRLREAERKVLQGLPVALWLDSLHRKNSIEKDAARAEEAEKKARSSKGEGRVDKWLKNATSDFFWRFYAGLSGSIKKARIVIVQDGVEIGCIIHSIEIVAGKEEVKVDVQMNEKDDSTTEEAMDTGPDISPPPDFVYEGTDDDGEHVDKIIKQAGLGVFVRKVASMAKVPRQLQFSTSVSADDYILRPVDLSVSFSFFYPYPPERRKKRAADTLSQGTHPTASTTRSGLSVGDSTTNTSTSKRRRGKREKLTPATSTDTQTPVPSNLEGQGIAGQNEHFIPLAAPRESMVPLAGDARTPQYHRTHRRLGSKASERAAGRPRMQRRKSGTFSDNRSLDEMSIGLGTEAAGIALEKPTEPFPRFDCNISFEEIRVVFSTRHYELLNYFLSSVARVKNGRPDKMIRSIRKNEANEIEQQLLEEVQESEGVTPEPVSSYQAAKEKMSYLLNPLSALRSGSHDKEKESDDRPNRDRMASSKLDPMSKSQMLSPRQVAVAKWWEYAIGAVLWEVRKGKSLTAMFRDMYISFDWSKQKLKREEYVNLYISVRLENRTFDETAWPFEEDTREQRLMKIEDELPIEQILLYRSIARSVRFQGLSKMPSSILELKKTKGAERDEPKSKKKTHRRGSSNSIHSADHDLPVQESKTLLSLIQRKFLFSKDLHSGGAGRVLRSSTSSFDRDGLPSSRRRASAGLAASTHSGSGEFHKMRRKSFGSMSNFSADFDMPRQRPQRRKSLGHDNLSDDFQAGNFYASAAKARDPVDGRTVRHGARGAKSVKPMAASSAGSAASVEDTAMRITVSFQVKSIDLMIIQEDFAAENAVFDEAGQSSDGLSAGGSLSDGEFSGSSSGDDVSELSILSEERQFFSESASMSGYVHEEEDAGAPLSSTDFLLFGLPNNVILRTTISPLNASFRAKSGGPKHIGLSIGKVVLLGDKGHEILALGQNQDHKPMADVNLGSGSLRNARRGSNDNGLGGSVHGVWRRNDSDRIGFSPGERLRSDDFSSRSRQDRAVSMYLVSLNSAKVLQCDFSKASVVVDLGPVGKLVRFFSESRVLYPDKIIPKSSREVARKFMVQKSTASTGSGKLSTYIKMHGLEVKIPFLKTNVHDADFEVSDAELSSSVDSDQIAMSVASSSSSEGTPHFSTLTSSSLELYSGVAVEEIVSVGTVDFAQSKSSMFSGSFASRKVTAKSLAMLDLTELTSSHDSFDSNHWVSAN